ncbi:MAG: flavodoxin domain-containing protein [Candidatus Hodarchaeales archaeon]|jgi:menaquinone-dependent protoporphyrinogen IX oxidase
MTQKRILIAYGSRYHSTAETSRKLGRYLEEQMNLNVLLVNLRKIERNSWPLLEKDKFAGVIVGTGIRISKWTKETRQFLEMNKNKVSDFKLVLGVFISCGYASDPSHYPIAIKEFMEDKFVKIGITPDIYDAFGGVFDFSPTSPHGSLNKQILKWGSRDLVMKIDYTQRNDYRDWNQIYDCARRFASKVNSP